MTIEPINNVMTYQAQTQAPRAVDYAPKADMDVTPDASKMVDTQTVYVKESGMKEDGQSGNNGAAGHQPSHEHIKKMVEELNSKIGNSEAIFGVHEETNRVTIKIVDKETKEVIREIPPEKTLDMIAKAWELAGILVDERR